MCARRDPTYPDPPFCDGVDWADSTLKSTHPISQNSPLNFPITSPPPLYILKMAVSFALFKQQANNLVETSGGVVCIVPHNSARSVYTGKPIDVYFVR